MPDPSPSAPTAAPKLRHLGRFQLLRLLHKTQATMLWLVADGVGGAERVLLLPRQAPADLATAERWLDGVRRAATVNHPGLLQPVDLGLVDRWPYLLYDGTAGSLLSQRLGPQGVPAAQLVPALLPALEGLAAAHEAGHLHGDLHPGMLLWLDDGSALRLLGLGCAPLAPQAGSVAQARRQACERDVLAIGLVMHQALVGRPPLDEPDTMLALRRLPPWGHEAVRLPGNDVQAIGAPLRAIVNRATDRQERQRYRSARTLLRALEGWLRTQNGLGGPMELLRDRLRVLGLLPSAPGIAQRTRRLQRMEREHLDGLAAIVLEDVALSFELLRAANVANRRVGARVVNGPILTTRRAIELLGLDGVRRAARVLKPWPGPLTEAQAGELSRELDLAGLAGRIAQWVRPAGYDAEFVYLLAALQRLGWLVVQYHFPDEAAQIRRLTRPSATPAPEGAGGGGAGAAAAASPPEAAMDEDTAAYAVLGTDLEGLGLAVAQAWGLGDLARHMMRRQPRGAAVHASEDDGERLRQTASCANELVEAQQLPPPWREQALHQVAQRYGRALKVSLEELRRYAQGRGPVDEDTDTDTDTDTETPPHEATPLSAHRH